MSSQQNLITVRGYVVALPGNQEGCEDAKVAVHKENGEEYVIIPRGMGIDLVDLINAGVEVTGALLERGGHKFIQVRQYKPQDEYDGHWYDDKD
ncbi:MAG: hypothetical protein LBM64_05020 [Deltaproteobacteria bacterium]|jgi:hypothetical protein|nr:hypothetical protein [Deltaproteobacteria bacterium]